MSDLGIPTIVSGQVTLSPTGIPSSEAIGNLGVNKFLSITQINDGSGLGSPIILGGSIVVSYPSATDGSASPGSPAVTQQVFTNVSNTISYQDSFTDSVHQNKTVSDSFVISDSHIRLVSRLRSLTDVISFADSNAPLKIMYRNGVDHLIIDTDNLLRALTLRRLPVDVTTEADILTYITSHLRDLVELTSTSDLLTYRRLIYISDQIGYQNPFVQIVITKNRRSSRVVPLISPKKISLTRTPVKTNI